MNRKVERTDATYRLTLLLSLPRLQLCPALLVFRFEALVIRAVGLRDTIRYLRWYNLGGHEELGWDDGGRA